MAKYQPDERRPALYRVPLRNAPAVLRPNRVAAGASYTLARSRAHLAAFTGRQHGADKPDTLRLVVSGTTDSLTARAWLYFRPSLCPCCGANTGKLQLTERGQARLARLRRLRARARLK